MEGTRDERGEPCPHKASANFATNEHSTAVKEWVGGGSG